jgi:hypothetical protein
MVSEIWGGIYIAQDVEVNLPQSFPAFALRPCLRGPREHSERGQDFLARSIDTNPLEIYIVLISCPDFTFSVSSKLQSLLERENLALRGSIAENLRHE